MQYINASHSIYRLAPHLRFVPRVGSFPRRNWPVVNLADVADVLVRATDEALRTLTNRRFSLSYMRVVGDGNKRRVAEAALKSWDCRIDEVHSILADAERFVFSLMADHDPEYSHLDMFTRAWTLAERLAVRSRPAPFGRLAAFLSGADLFSFGLAAYWRGFDQTYLHRHFSDSLPEYAGAVAFRGSDENFELCRELWVEATAFRASVTSLGDLLGNPSVCAVVCVEALLLGKANAQSEHIVALLGGYLAQLASTLVTASPNEDDSSEWVKKYFFFMAGSSYSATKRDDLALAVYRAFGIAERRTSEEALAALAAAAGWDDTQLHTSPIGITLLLDRSIELPDLSVHLLGPNTASHSLQAGDYAPLLPRPVIESVPSLSEFRAWLRDRSLLMRFGSASPEGTLSDAGSDIVLELLYDPTIATSDSYSFDDLVGRSSFVRLRLRRHTPGTIRLREISISRNDSKADPVISRFASSFDGEGFMLVRMRIVGERLDDGLVRQERVMSWNESLLADLNVLVHEKWNEQLDSTTSVLTA